MKFYEVEPDSLSTNVGFIVHLMILLIIGLSFVCLTLIGLLIFILIP